MGETDTILASIQKGNSLKGYQNEVRNFLKENPRTIVILDDDPTGSQTVQNIPVITQWSEALLEKEIIESPVFFILTNSRALQKMEAIELTLLIGKRLKKLAALHQKKLVVISRSDSTLRGHYPEEVIALSSALGYQETKHALIPAFFEGGRYTYNDVHYVQEGDAFIPAAETPFAKDGTFGYASSNLHDYVLEKYSGAMQPDNIASVGLNELRSKDFVEQTQQLMDDHLCVIVNGTGYGDLEAFALALLQSNKNLVYRTAASFINAITGKRPAPLLIKKEVVTTKSKNGALIVVGSYVRKTTKQLNHLQEKYKAVFLKLNVEELFTEESKNSILKNLAHKINNTLRDGDNVVLYTSREMKAGMSKEENLKIVNKVSKAITDLIRQIEETPRFMLTKGGITSCDIAVKALQTKRAMVMGQLIKGVPVWRLDAGSKFPDMPYIIFPGNVGSDGDLYNVLKKME